MKWTQKTYYIKLLLLCLALIIAGSSLWFSNRLAKDLATEEHVKMEILAEAMRSLNLADENTDLNLVLQIINKNNTIPIVVLNEKNKLQAARNLSLKPYEQKDSVKIATQWGLKMKQRGHYIRLETAQFSNHYMDVCYDKSLLLTRLTFYPYIQMGIVVLFLTLVGLALLWLKRAEQNRIWVGLSKETAHQLGTPISSLMAWNEILKENYPQDELINEMGKDINRLQLIADRFSKIGSKPKLEPFPVNTIIENVATYIDKRTSSKVQIFTHFSANNIKVCLTPLLFEWVIENLCKNAVDAMEGKGSIYLNVKEEKERVIIDVTDTGKGIKKKNIAHVFQPGFTTKKRGWGLGLSLAKRIIEEYHKGKIFVKHSELGVGTTFRIELKQDLTS